MRRPTLVLCLALLAGAAPAQSADAAPPTRDASPLRDAAPSASEPRDTGDLDAGPAGSAPGLDAAVVAAPPSPGPAPSPDGGDTAAVAPPSPAPAADAAGHAQAEPAHGESAKPPPAEVRVGDTIVYTVRTGRGDKTAAARAKSANDALRDALAANPDDVRVEHAGEVSVVYVGARPIVQLTSEDAAAAGDASLTVHADRVAADVRAALKAEQQRSAVAGTIFNVSLAVLFAVLAVFLLRRAWELGDRADAWLERNPDRVPALRLRTVEVLHRTTVRAGLALALAAGRWIVLFGLVYAWLIATFSLFEATRGLTERLSGALLSPLAALASRVAATVPLLVVIVFAVLTLALVLRAVRLFFHEVARGTTTVSWLPKDLAAPTGTLAQFAVVILALVLVAPVITGTPDGAATRMGLLLLGTIGLAAVPVVASAVVGGVTLFARRLAVGDWVELGPRSGRVVGLGLLETTLRDAAGVEVKVPHLLRLWNPTRVHGPTPRVTVTLVVDRPLATPALAARLERALASIGTSAVVRLAEVGATHATLELTVSSAAADARSAMLWAAVAEVDASRAGA